MFKIRSPYYYANAMYIAQIRDSKINVSKLSNEILARYTGGLQRQVAHETYAFLDILDRCIQAIHVLSLDRLSIR